MISKKWAGYAGFTPQQLTQLYSGYDSCTEDYSALSKAFKPLSGELVLLSDAIPEQARKLRAILANGDKKMAEMGRIQSFYKAVYDEYQDNRGQRSDSLNLIEIINNGKPEIAICRKDCIEILKTHGADEIAKHLDTSKKPYQKADELSTKSHNVVVTIFQEMIETFLPEQKDNLKNGRLDAVYTAYSRIVSGEPQTKRDAFKKYLTKK